MSGALPVGPITIDVNRAAGAWPEEAKMDDLVRRAIGAAVDAARPALAAGSELSVMLTDNAAMRALNARWRGTDKATNVLAFPQDGGPMLGDIVLAFETVREEAALANKPLEHHIAHLIIHGFFHIIGYNHADDRQANAMETLERAALSCLGIADPHRPACPSS